MENNREYIDELIARCLSGNATEADKVLLAEWKSQSAENKKYYDDLSFIYEASAVMADSYEVDTEKAWKTLSGNMQKAAAPVIPIRPRKNASGLFLKIAAVIVFLIGISAILYLELGRGGRAGNAVSIVARQAAVKQTLADGSKITVQPNSSLLAWQGGGSREYKLAGEAQFDVVHNMQAPFVIHAGHTLIRDIGTRFNVKARPDEDSVSVWVEAGSVHFYAGNQAGLILKAGEKGYYLQSTGRFTLAEPETRPEDALQFRNATLLEISEKLNAIYGVHILFGNDHIKACRMTVTFQHSDLKEMIEIITQTFSLQSKEENNTITLYGKGCE